MKGQHRHELETNALAKRLGDVIERSRPYGPTILGVLVAIVLCLMAVSYMTSSSTAQQSEAWSQYFAAMQTPNYNFEQSMQLLKQSAEEHPDTSMQQWADITWADGQVWLASQVYLQDHPAASQAMSRAASVYKSLIKTTSDDRMANRANFGLGRIYEMENDLARAKEHYALVQGGFSELAKARIEQIDDPTTKEDLAKALSWLSTAQVPRRAPPSGPGTPGKQPLFAPGELQMPQSGSDAKAGTASEASMDDLLDLDTESDAAEGDRYKEGESAPGDEQPKGDSDAGASPTSEP